MLAAAALFATHLLPVQPINNLTGTLAAVFAQQLHVQKISTSIMTPANVSAHLDTLMVTGRTTQMNKT